MLGAQLAKKKTSAVPRKPSLPDFAAVFAALRLILGPLQDELAVQTDKPGNYHTEMPEILHRGKPMYFAGVRSGKNYVSFYLMPMYNCADLQKGMSPALKKRMQGRACFNFTEIDQDCFAELGRLIADGLKRFKSKEFQQTIKDMQ